MKVISTSHKGFRMAVLKPFWYNKQKRKRGTIMKTLVVYFSAEGTTAALAEKFAKEIIADTFEIRPQKLYTKSDLNWKNPMSRCNKEKFGKKDVPVEGTVENFEAYDEVLIGFPIWYGCAPNVVNTFCKAYDWTGKKVAAFATSGGSGIGKTKAKLQLYVNGALVQDAVRVKDLDELKAWAESL